MLTPSPLEKVRTTVRLEQLLSQQERAIRQALARFIVDARSERTMREVRRLLQQNNMNAALDLVDEHIAAMGNVIPQVFYNVAVAELEAIGPRYERPRLAKAAIGFDPSNDRAARIMRSSKLRFIQEFSNRQREATRDALASAFAEGEGVRTAARAFRDSIGLTRTQMAAVTNYRRLLEEGSAEALARDLRDRRYDRTVESSLETGEPLDSGQIDRMVDRYQERMLIYRSENIARTEALRALSEGRQEALEQLIGQAGIEPEQVRRTWVATKDKRTRDSHSEMDGQTVGLHESFTSGLGNQLMYPGDGPPADSINCRCTVLTTILTPDEVAAAA